MTLDDKLQRILHDEAVRNAYVREPICGWNRADHPVFAGIKQAHPFHRTPDEMLLGARSVFAFFLPFTVEVVRSNRTPGISSKLWCEAYIATNQNIRKISESLITLLNAEGFRAIAEPATHNFCEETLVAVWSHKHMAYACGLGSFGLHHMLITSEGCAGRFGSIVTDLTWDGDTQVAELYADCLYFKKGVCQWCVDHCVNQALTREGLDKHRCYEQCKENDRNFPQLEVCDVCGKCAVGPCGVKRP